jgi:hypothetical protein
MILQYILTKIKSEESHLTHFMCLLHVIHDVGSNQFLSVNIGVIRLLSVITTTPFGNYGTSETMFDQLEGGLWFFSEKIF